MASSAIEGTQTSVSELFAYEAGESMEESLLADAAEVTSYITALEYGIEQLRSVPVSVRLIRDVHHRLIAGAGRANDPRPGRFRDTQVHIGGRTLVRRPTFSRHPRRSKTRWLTSRRFSMIPAAHRCSSH